MVMSSSMGVWVSNRNQTAFDPCYTASRLTIARASMDRTSKRSVCPSCSKPLRTCLCSRFQSPPLDNSVSVTILQHALERNHPLNSSRIAKLGLKNVIITNVSDVLTEATFVIQWADDSQQGFKMCTPPVFENAAQAEESAEAQFSDIDDVMKLRVDSSKYCHSDPECLVLPGCVEAPTITVTMGRYGSQCSCELQFLPYLSSHKPSFDQVLAVPEVACALASGFQVKRRVGNLQSDTGSDIEPHTEFEIDVPRGSVLLFPSDSAVGVSDLQSRGVELKNLIVLDGTWAKATRMYSENPWLKALPHLKLELDQSSLYGEVRSQPKDKCLSTIESIVYALKAVGDSPDGLDGLLDVFESMVEDQRRCMHERLSNLSHV